MNKCAKIKMENMNVNNADLEGIKMEIFTEKVIHMIKSIPVGRVMTYGQIARLAGNPRGARQVARILHSMSIKHRLPWHRILNARGEISFGESEIGTRQKQYLLDEGVDFINDKYVDLRQYLYEPR